MVEGARAVPMVAVMDLVGGSGGYGSRKFQTLRRKGLKVSRSDFNEHARFLVKRFGGLHSTKKGEVKMEKALSKQQQPNLNSAQYLIGFR